MDLSETIVEQTGELLKAACLESRSFSESPTGLEQTSSGSELSGFASSSWASDQGYLPLESPPTASQPDNTISDCTEPLVGFVGSRLSSPPSNREIENLDSSNMHVTLDIPLARDVPTSQVLSGESESGTSSIYTAEGDDSAASASHPSVQQRHFKSSAQGPLPTILEGKSQNVPASPAPPLASDGARIYKSRPGSLSDLPEQRKRISYRNGVSFTLMVAGESGSGKSTFVNMLLGDCAKSPRHISRVAAPHQSISGGIAKPSDVHRTTEIEIHECIAEENGFEAQFTVVDTPGFGDYANNLYAWIPITNYIDAQYQRYMCGEEQPRRDRLKDTRVHVCVYFLQPTGHDLLPLDITSMKEIGSRVNLVPVISKSDSQTVEEIAEFKRIVRECISTHNIPVFTPEEEHLHWPYALVSSTDKVRASDGREVLGRHYDWGTVEVDNPAHSDLPWLKEVLMGTEMLNLIDRTHGVHYQRTRRDLRLRRFSTALKSGAKGDSASEGKSLKQAHSVLTQKVGILSPHEEGQQLLKSPATVEPKPAFNKHAIAKIARKMTGLEILTAVSPFGYAFLEEQRIEEDLLYRQRVRGITDQFGVVLKFQLQRFEQEARELEKKDKQFRAELEELELANKQIEQRISELEACRTRRKW